MGRELKRKQEKKEGQILKEKENVVNQDPYSDIYKLLKTFGFILVIVLAIHFFTALIITKEIEWFSKEDDKVGVEKIKVTNSILAKNTFMQKDEEYYVYFYDFDKPNSNIDILVNSKLSESSVYKVDTTDAFNSNYVTDEVAGNSSANSIDNLKVVNPTIIKISAGSIVEYYETEDGVINYLENK